MSSTVKAPIYFVQSSLRDATTALFRNDTTSAETTLSRAVEVAKSAASEHDDILDPARLVLTMARVGAETALNTIAQGKDARALGAAQATSYALASLPVSIEPAGGRS